MAKGWKFLRLVPRLIHNLFKGLEISDHGCSFAFFLIAKLILVPETFFLGLAKYSSNVDLFHVRLAFLIALE